jgi:microsomal dipeptidase-like Zn-dependent dipeptidase
MLSKRGYSDVDIEKIMRGNWLRMLGRVLPAG